MQIIQSIWKTGKGWKQLGKENNNFEKSKAQLVLCFGERTLLEKGAHYDELRKEFPKAEIVLGSSAGEIIENSVFDDTVTCTAVMFEKTDLTSKSFQIKDGIESQNIGEKIGETFSKEDKKGALKFLLVLSDGTKVNGSKLLKGINSKIPKGVLVTGGLVGDGARFQKTVLGLNAKPEEGKIVVLGFSGNHIKVGHGSVGGWDAFGPIRKITKSTANVLFEMDNQPALPLYKKYLGDKAKDLPASGLLFPLNINKVGDQTKLVRTILAVDETNNSLTFAGDIPEGYEAQLMKANFDKLVEGAANAATNAKNSDANGSAELAILISCVGRKLVLGPRIEDEIEGVRGVLGKKSLFTGFYSYGELSPYLEAGPCELHNQTMTITTLYESL